MTTLSSIEKRVTELEEKSGEDRTLIFVEFEGVNAEESTRHVYNQCEKCCDPEVLNSALDEAMMRAENPPKEHLGNIIVITKEIALEVARILKTQCITTSL